MYRKKAPDGMVLLTLMFALYCVASTLANEDVLTEEEAYQQRCYGVFSKSAIPNGVDPYISVTFKPKPDVPVAVVFYEFKDEPKLGRLRKDGSEKVLVCDDEAVHYEYCQESQHGNFIIPEKDQGSIVTKSFDKNDTSYKYPIEKTGYYCVSALKVDKLFDKSVKFTAKFDWRNPYGELPASDYPKLPFYGLLSLVYLVIGIVWMTLSIMHWREILPVQNYISGVILFLMIEMAFNWGYWENFNAYGSSSKLLLSIVAVLNAGRNTISFFMLLVVCMGYGVVKPTLGTTMTKCRLLAGAHFVFGIIYSVGTMLVNPETGGPIVLLIIFPLALTLTIFHVWTLQSLTTTIQTLEIRKQNVKALMYRRLYRLLVFSVTVLALFFLINMINYMHREDPDFYSRYWHWKWFLLDGWLNILYLIVFTVIVILWRPTRNNKRFAMSEQLGQDDVDDVEINNLRSASNLGYDNMKYRDRLNGNNESHVTESDAAIFDIGDEIDDDDDYSKWSDDGGTNINVSKSESQQHLTADIEESGGMHQDEEQRHVQQELNKMN